MKSLSLARNINSAFSNNLKTVASMSARNYATFQVERAPNSFTLSESPKGENTLEFKNIRDTFSKQFKNVGAKFSSFNSDNIASSTTTFEKNGDQVHLTITEELFGNDYNVYSKNNALVSQLLVGIESQADIIGEVAEHDQGSTIKY